MELTHVHKAVCVPKPSCHPCSNLPRFAASTALSVISSEAEAPWALLPQLSLWPEGIPRSLIRDHIELSLSHTQAQPGSRPFVKAVPGRAQRMQCPEDA